jgi:hypothetical protein
MYGSNEAIIGYAIEAADGPAGRVADFLIEEESAVVTGIVVSTRGVLPLRRRACVPINAVQRVDTHERRIYLHCTRDDIKAWSKKRCA